MRLAPIERPTGILMRLAYWASRRQFGKVIAPLKVMYARKPRLLLLSLHVQRVLERGLSLEPSLRLLVQAQVARLNGCAFCQDLALAEAFRHELGAERFTALPEYRSSEIFSARERAALAFVEEVTADHGVSEATRSALHAAFGETQVVELAWVCAVETYFNRLTAALGIESDHLAGPARNPGPG